MKLDSIMKTTPIAIFGVIAILAAPIHAGTTESESEVFAFDTRDSTGTVVGESGVFGVDARDWGGWSSRSSGFGLDTRGGGTSGNIQITGTVLDTDGLALFGATVELKRYATVFWSGTTDFSGGYAVPQQAAADYTVVASMSGFASQVWNVGGEGGQVVDFSLQAAPDVPGLADVVREIAPGAVRGELVAGADLRLFQGGSFGSDLSALDPTRPTIVITHGWNPTKTDFAQDSFVTEMAAMILANHGLWEAPNIVAWDWKARAATAGPETDAAAEEGIAMGKALHQALGSDYAEPIHFIGHSLGTLVNRYACDCLHGDLRHASDNASPPWDPDQTHPHATILDEAEVASVLGEDVMTSAAIGWKIAKLKGALIAGTLAAKVTWKDPIPESAEWIDNYISAVGFYRDEAVNVCLLKPSTTLSAGNLYQDILDAHGYAHEWYRGTVGEPSSANGFQWALASGNLFPPTGDGFVAGDRWYENLDTSTALDVSRTRPDMGFYGWEYDVWESRFDGSFPVLFGAGVLAQSSAYDGIVWVGEKTVGAMVKVGNVIIDTTVKTGHFIDAAADASMDVLSSIDPMALVTGPLSAPVWRFRLTSGNLVAAGPMRGGPQPKGSEVQDLGIWFDLDIPAEAAFLAFDFTVTGDPVEDRIACAINDENLFTLAARFTEPGQVTSTDLLDISKWAGQTVEIFFGFTGGTSSGCEVAIDGLRFQTMPPPRVAVSTQGGQLRVAWPATASGWLLESSPDLTPGSWQPEPLNAAVLEEGMSVLEGPVQNTKKFFRLRRNDPEQ